MVEADGGQVDLCEHIQGYWSNMVSNQKQVSDFISTSQRKELSNGVVAFFNNKLVSHLLMYLFRYCH